MGHALVALIVGLMIRAAAGNDNYELTAYRDSPGVYFEELGHAALSTTARTIVIYVPIQLTDGETSQLEQYVHYIDNICSRMSVKNWSTCSHFSDIMNQRLQQIRCTQQLLSDITQGKTGDTQHR